MLTSRYKKDNVIILPNKDKLPIGKIKDTNKFMNMVSAEYGIEGDTSYFAIEKEKHHILFKLQYIPRGVTEIRTPNAKKFVIYELVKNSHSCAMKLDEELNKRALVINDLLNTIDDNCKETITSKLDSMFENPEELDYLLDQLLTDPQFNSFKYTVLDSSKTSCLLCVNSYGLSVRSLEPPHEVVRQLSWEDIDTVKTKGTRLIFHKKSNGGSEDIVCINKKTVLAAHKYLQRYLAFIGGSSADNKRVRGGWFGSMALRIRQSFSGRRTRTQDSSEPQTSAAHSSAVTAAPSKCAAVSGHSAPPNSTVPGSSVVSDDCLDNLGSVTMEPSIKTNSTHDVSLGSASSYHPGPSSLLLSSGPEDHISVKTTSTYEVNLDTLTPSQSQRTQSSGSRTDQDPTPTPIMSLSGPTIQAARKSPPLSQLKDSVFSETMRESADDSTVTVDTPGPVLLLTAEVQVAHQSHMLETRFSEVPQDMGGQVEESEGLKSERGQTGLIVVASDAMEICLPVADELIHDTDGTGVTEKSGVIVAASGVHAECVPMVEESIDGAVVMGVAEKETLMTNVGVADTHSDIEMMATEVERLAVVKAEEVVSVEIVAPTQIVALDDIVAQEEILSPERPLVPGPHRKSIPSPKVQRPTRIPSVPTSPTSHNKAPSPSDKENYNGTDDDRNLHEHESQSSANFSRFENEQYTVDSKTTFTSVSSTAETITKKFTKTEISSVKTVSPPGTGIPAPRQYKTTTTITSTVKKPMDGSKSPIVGANASTRAVMMTAASGIPRMASK